jgi:hypothetical protein
MPKAIRESDRAFNHSINAPHSLTQELIKDYPHSGFKDVKWDESDLVSEWAVEWDEYGWPPNDEEIQAQIRPWSTLKVKNRNQGLFAPIRLYCPQACGETLDTTTLLDHAQVDFWLSLEDLEQLTIYEFTCLIYLLLRWRRSYHEEDRAWVRSEADRMRRTRTKYSYIPGSKVVLKALEIFPHPESPDEPKNTVGAMTPQLNKSDRWCFAKIKESPGITLSTLVGLGKKGGSPARSTIGKSLGKLKKLGLVINPVYGGGYHPVG